MNKTSQMQIRLDPDLKSDAEGILAQIGLSATEFVRMSLRQLVMRNGLPFDAIIPNAETIEALKEKRCNLESYTDTKKMMNNILSEK